MNTIQAKRRNHPAHEKLLVALWDAIQACDELHLHDEDEECECETCIAREAVQMQYTIQVFADVLDAEAVPFIAGIERDIAEQKAEGRDTAALEQILERMILDREIESGRATAQPVTAREEITVATIVADNPFYKRV